MVLFYDVTKAASSKQHSGLIRVSGRLRQSLEERLVDELVPVEWVQRKKSFQIAGSREKVVLTSSDHFLTPEVFSSDNRPGLYQHLIESGVKSAAVFHDAIPYKYPDITWPKSVERHPLYMRDLAGLDQIFSVSQASQNDLLDFWKSAGLDPKPEMDLLRLGADFIDRSQTEWKHQPGSLPVLVNVGIIEPRKNQEELLEVACGLWDQGYEFELHFAGRINPHFGKPIAKKIKKAQQAGYAVFLQSKQSDRTLLNLYSKAHFTVFNSITEGFGLPVVESLWLGIPCLTRCLPSLDEYIDGKSCVGVRNPGELETAMTAWLSDSKTLASATSTAADRVMGRWKDTVEPILKWKGSS